MYRCIALCIGVLLKRFNTLMISFLLFGLKQCFTFALRLRIMQFPCTIKLVTNNFTNIFCVVSKPIQILVEDILSVLLKPNACYRKYLKVEHDIYSNIRGMNEVQGAY